MYAHLVGTDNNHNGVHVRGTRQVCPHLNNPLTKSFKTRLVCYVIHQQNALYIFVELIAYLKIHAHIPIKRIDVAYIWEEVVLVGEYVYVMNNLETGHIPTSRKNGCPAMSNMFTFTSYSFGRLIAVTPKSIPRVAMYFETNRFSQYLLIRQLCSGTKCWYHQIIRPVESQIYIIVYITFPHSAAPILMILILRLFRSAGPPVAFSVSGIFHHSMHVCLKLTMETSNDHYQVMSN